MNINKYKNLLLSASNILVIRTDRIGDMILTLPLCRALKENIPDAKIHLAARTYVEPILRHNSIIDFTHFIDSNENNSNDNLREILKNNKFDAVFFPRPRFDEAWEAFKVKIPLRIGSAYRLYSNLFNIKIKDHRKISEFHEAEYNTRMLGFILNREIETKLVRPIIDSNARIKLKNILGKLNFDINQNYLIIHPGSGGSARDASINQFIKINSYFTNKYNLKSIITGIESEREICNNFQKEFNNSINLCGLLKLDETMSLIENSKLLVANSTGIIHIAASLDIPVVGFYPKEPHLSDKRWGPYTNKKIIFTPEEDLIFNNNYNLLKFEKNIIL